MSECHTCPHSVRIQRGDYKGIPFNRTPCATCSLSDAPSHKGRSHVSRDSSEAVDVIESMAAYEKAGEASDSARIADLVEFVARFMGLDALTRDLVAIRFVSPDKPIRDIAKQYCITTQAAHSRIKRALATYPVLRKVIHMRTLAKG
jgi:hypothetical protein